MSIKYYYVNDLNKLYNAAIGNKTDGGEYHMAMMEAHDNLEEYIQKIEHRRDTALQLSKNLGTAQNKIDNLEQDYAVSNRELLILQVEINRLNADLARRDEIIARLKEDTERFEKRAITYVYLEDTPPYYECQLCFHDADELDNILHDKSCPITLHRALMKELE